MPELLIKTFRYNDARLHWETYVERFRKKYADLYHRCTLAGLEIDHEYIFGLRKMEVKVRGESLDGANIKSLISEISDAEL
jgi:hypothetical protein